MKEDFKKIAMPMLWPMSRIEICLSLLLALVCIGYITMSTQKIEQVLGIVLLVVIGTIFVIRACRYDVLIKRSDVKIYITKVDSLYGKYFLFYRSKTEEMFLPISKYQIVQSGEKQKTLLFQSYDNGLWYYLGKDTIECQKLGRFVRPYLYVDPDSNEKTILSIQNHDKFETVAVDAYYCNLYVHEQKEIIPSGNYSSSEYLLYQKNGKYQLVAICKDETGIFKVNISAPAISFKKDRKTILLRNFSKEGRNQYQIVFKKENEYPKQSDEVCQVYDGLNKICRIYKYDSAKKNYIVKTEGKFQKIEDNQVIY